MFCSTININTVLIFCLKELQSQDCFPTSCFLNFLHLSGLLLVLVDYIFLNMMEVMACCSDYVCLHRCHMGPSNFGYGCQCEIRLAKLKVAKVCVFSFLCLFLSIDSNF